MTDNIMPTIMVIEGDSADEMGELQMCEQHEAELRMALIQRGYSEDLELTDEERGLRLLSGQPDAYLQAKNRLILGCLQVFGANIILANDGCPVCTFHSVIDQAADGVAMTDKRRN